MRKMYVSIHKFLYRDAIIILGII